MSSQNSQSNPEAEVPISAARKWCARLLRCALAAFIAILIILGGMYWFLQRDPHALARGYLEELEKATGLKCSFGSVIVTLLPLPTIAIYDLSIEAENAGISIALTLARPAIADLLEGKFIPASLSIFRPVFSARTELDFEKPFTVPGQIKELLESSFARSDGGEKREINLPDLVSLSLRNGRIRIRGRENSGIFSRNIHADFDYIPGIGLKGKAQAARFRVFRQREPIFALEKPAFDGVFAAGKAERVHFSTAMAIPGWLEKGKLSLQYSQPADGGWELAPDLQCFFTPGRSNMPAGFSGRITSLAGSDIIVASGLEFYADADRGTASLMLKTGSSLAEYSLRGSVQFGRFSLTEWLGFARNLPPGLQMALDNISRARLEFQLNSKGLEVSSIVASSSGATFTGTGGVPDFSRPVVTLDLRSPKVNLGLGLPEALAQSPDPVYFPFPPLTPLPGEPLKDGETGIGYDVKLAAETLIYGPFTLSDASLRIYPGKLDKQLMLEDVLLDGKASLAGGKLSASCILGADPSLPCNIKASASGLNAKILAAQWPKLSILKGSLHGSLDVFSKGKTLESFLKNLNGPLNVQAANLATRFTGNVLFSKLELATKLRSAQLEQGGASFDGQWRLNGECEEANFNSDLSGRVQIDSRGLGLRAMQSSLNATLFDLADSLPKTLKLNAKAVLSGNSSSGSFELQNLALDGLGGHISGNAAFNSAKMSCSGKIAANFPDFQGTMKNLGFKSRSIPAAFNSLKLDGSLALSTERLKLENMRATLGTIALAGSLGIQMGKIPDLSFALSADALDLNNFKSEGEAPASGKWDFSFLKNFNANGTLKVGSVKGFGLSLNNLELPLKLGQGKLVAGPARGAFYGSTLQMRGNADFSKGISFSSVTSVRNFNLGEAARERKMESDLSGRASLEMNIRSDLTGPNQLVKNMDGNWTIKVDNGSWQGRGKNGKPEGKATRFELVSASGTIGKGFIRSDNILLKSPDLSLDGKGWMNLVNNTIDCNLNVNMKNLPDFPLHIYGPVAKPESSIGAGRMMLNAIGGMFTGIGSLFGGIMDGFINIFR